MRLRSILLTGAVALGTTQVNAQNWVEDTVTMGPGYANDVFYSLKNGSVKTEPNMTWHLAFQTTPQGPYGNVSVFANQVQGGVQIYPLHMSANTHFATLSAADTVGKTAMDQQQFNSDSTWNLGAFNKMNDPADPFDFSWGQYNMGTHDVLGDSLYLVTVTNGPTTEAYKIWIQRYDSSPADSVHWEFRIAKFDGTEDTLIKIYRKPAFEDRLFAYYNVETQTVSDREPGRSTWDLLFTRYKEFMPGAPGVPYYSVMGVLANFDVTVAEMQHVAADDTVGYVGYSYVSKMNEIGSDWKTFDNTTMQWSFEDSTYYFVKTKNTNEYYQLHFTGFGGAGTGKAMFKKRFLGIYDPMDVATVNTPLNAFKIAPNPAGNNVSLMIDAKEQMKDAQVMITDLTGKVVFRANANMNSGLTALNVNTASFASGTYVVVLTGGTWKVTEKLIVQH